MVNFQTIAKAFNRIGLNENTLVSQAEMLRALDGLAQSNGFHEYDRNVAQEIWNQTNKENGNKVYVRDFINTVIKGQGLVRSSISDLERQLQGIDQPQQRNQIIGDIASYSQDLKYLSVPFGVTAPYKSQFLAQSHFSTPANNQSRYSGHSTVIFSKQLPERESGSSTDLKIAFLLTCVLTFIEMILMFHKHHFLSLLAYLSIFTVFFLGNFDLHYMRFVKLLLLLSVLFDLIWIFVNASQYWNPKPQTQHSSLQQSFLKFVVLFVIVLDFFKIVLLAILFKYRNNSSQLRKNVELCGQKYNLSAKPHSLFAQVINSGQKNNNQGHEYQSKY